MLEVRLLGTFEIKSGKKQVSLTSRAAQSLFAFLALNAGTAFRREKLAGLLWPDSTEEQARDYLRHALWRIRRALQEASAAAYLRADDLTIAFEDASDCWLDTGALRKVGEQVPTDELIEVLSAYRGELLPGFYDEWVLLERENLQAIYERKAGVLLDRLQEAGRWSDMQVWAENWIALGQKPEAAYRYLMQAYAANGEMAKAAAAHERCRRDLAEFGLEPSEQTKKLFENIKAGRAPAGVRLPAPAAAPAHPAPKLPIPLTSFIGRQREVSQISQLLAGQRLVTIVGPGGVGKTRLAIECASGAVRRYRDGVYWIDLVGLSDGGLIPQELAGVLGLREIGHGSVLDAVRNYLKARQVLLVFDNCEHLTEAVAQHSQELLTGCPGVTILTTSRERLGLLNEAVWQAPPLDEPESLRLFCERAATVQPGFSVNDSNLGTLQQICTRLDGMPLAIELAAARLSLLSTEEIAKRLDSRFALLTSGNRGALPRHQTLRATIDWSYELLAGPEQLLLNRLSVFRGGFDMEAAEEVCVGEGLARAEILDALGRLVDKSLVVAQLATGRAESRYRLLETIRQYADEKLLQSGGMERLRDRHLEFFQRLAERAEPMLFASNQGQWFGRLEGEIDNLRSAIEWSMVADSTGGSLTRPQRVDLGLRLGGALGYFWERNYRLEAIGRLETMVLMQAGGGAPMAKAHMALGFLYWASTNHHAAEPHLDEAASMAEQVGDAYVLAWSHGYLGAVRVALGRYAEAKNNLESAVRLAQAIEAADGNVALWSNGFLGDIPFAQGDNAAARRLYEHVHDAAEKRESLNLMTYVSRRLGYLALRENRFGEAERHFRESLEANRRIDHLQGINRCLAAFAGLRAAQGRRAEAVQLCAAVQSFMQSTGASFFHWDEAFFNEVLAGLRSRLDAAAFQQAWNEGTAMGLDRAIVLVTTDVGEQKSHSQHTKKTRAGRRSGMRGA